MACFQKTGHLESSLAKRFDTAADRMCVIRQGFYALTTKNGNRITQALCWQESLNTIVNLRIRVCLIPHHQESISTFLSR